MALINAASSSFFLEGIALEPHRSPVLTCKKLKEEMRMLFRVQLVNLARRFPELTTGHLRLCGIPSVLQSVVPSVPVQNPHCDPREYLGLPPLLTQELSTQKELVISLRYSR